MKLIYSMLAICILSACAGSTLKDSKALEAIQQVKSYENLAPNQYQTLKEIKGLSCGKFWWDRSSENEAVKFLKAEAVATGMQFDGITRVNCKDTGWSWSDNCNNSYTCTGSIIKLLKK